MAKVYLLNNLKFDNVENLEVFSIKYIKSNIDLSKYDALLFTSKNAIYSLDSFNKSWKKAPSFAIASKTAKIIENYGGNVEFIGNSGHGNDFANEIYPYLENKKVLYIRAKKVVSSLVSILKEKNIDIDELITYETVCNKVNKTLEKNSIFIFTSPSSVECFFENYSWDKSYKAIVIGKTTSKYLPKEVDFKVSSKTSVEECVKLAFKELF